MPMCAFVAKIAWAPLLLIAAFMLLAPFQPMPHLWEKWQMFRQGTLSRPIDIFDVFWHLWPMALVALKLYCEKAAPL
jgi:hypothetical protein